MRTRNISFFAMMFFLLFTSMGFSQATTKGQLKEAIDTILEEAEIGNPATGIYIQANDTGAVLYDRNSDLPLKPASCNKLQSGVAALYYLGPEFRFKTPVYMRGFIRGKTLEGDLIVIGSGDPSISGRYRKDKDVTGIFKEWAGELKKLGIKRIEGNIIGDDDYFDDDYFGAGWPSGERGEWYSAEVSALTYNDNTVDVHWKGGRKEGKSASFELDPETEYIKFVNQVKTGSKTSSKKSNFLRKDKMNVIIGKGSVPPKQTMTDWCSVYNPTLFFTTVLKETLEEEGVAVEGKPIDADDDPELKETLYGDTSTTLVAYWESPPMMDLLEIVNTHSHNLFAELLFKKIGRRVTGKGSFQASGQAVEDFLRKERLLENGSIIIDGSGLSHLNRTTAKQLVNVLRYSRTQPWWGEYLDTLPRGQTKGYLKRQFDWNEESRKIGKRIYGKTGYIGGVVTLSGVVSNEEGKEIFYSILFNGYRASTSRVREVANKIAFELARSRLP